MIHENRFRTLEAGKADIVDVKPEQVSVSGNDVATHLRGGKVATPSRFTVLRALVPEGFRIPRPPFYLITLFAMVILPSIATQYYLFFIASDQYQASARFAVRSAQDDAKQATNALNSLSQGGGFTNLSLVGQDASIVVSYIKSRAILDDLSSRIDIRAMYSRPDADFWARLPKDATIEELTDYWKSMVTTNVDGPSGIVTVYARAFRREDALKLVNAVIDASERLVNEVSARSRRDAMSRAENEMRRSEGMVRDALGDMRALRESAGFIDPVATATATGKLIAETMITKIKLENELFVASRIMSPNAPSIAAMMVRLQGINEQIDKLKSTLTGDGQGTTSLTKSLVRFEEVELKRIFAEKLYTLSQDSLERARVAAERQNIYVSVFVPAAMPEESRFPERASLSIIIPMTLIVIWGIFALLMATIEDHRI